MDCEVRTRTSRPVCMFGSAVEDRGSARYTGGVRPLWRVLTLVTLGDTIARQQDRQGRTNFASFFSGWDRLLGTSRLDPGREQIQAGLDAYASLDQTTVVRFWTIPFGRACPGPRDAAVRTEAETRRSFPSG